MAGQDNSRYGAAATAAPVLTASARPRRRRVKVFAQAFFKRLAGCGTASHGLSRLRQTQENRKTVQRTVFRKKPSSGVSWAGPRPAEGFHKPACPARESVRRPLTQAGGKGKHGASATGSVAVQEGDIRPPFFCVWEGRGCAPAPLVDRRAPPYNPQLLKKLAKLLLVST